MGKSLKKFGAVKSKFGSYNQKAKLRFATPAHFVMLQLVLRCFPVSLDFFGEAPFVDFGWTVIYPECADFAKDLFDDGLVSHARPAHDLNAAVGDTH